MATYTINGKSYKIPDSVQGKQLEETLMMLPDFWLMVNIALTNVWFHCRNIALSLVSGFKVFTVLDSMGFLSYG